MTIKEFIKNRTCERQAVQRYILRHPELFDGHIVKQGKEFDLDDVAVRILAEKYPLAKPVQVIQGIPQEDYDALDRKYQKALEDGMQLAKEYAKITKWQAEKAQEIAAADQRTLQLKAANDAVKALEAQNRDLSDDNEKKDKSLTELETKLEAASGELREALAREKDKDTKMEKLLKRNLWQRIWNKE